MERRISSRFKQTLAKLIAENPALLPTWTIRVTPFAKERRKR